MADIVVNKYSTTDIDSLTAALDGKLRKDITFATVTDLSLSLSDFNGGLGVYFEDDENVAVTVNNDLKDGIARYINVINTHASAIISVTLPAPRIYVNDVSAIPVLAGCQIQIQFYWDSAQSAFVYLDSVNMKKVLV